VDIEDRPAEVEERNRIGHWEAYLVSGKNHRGFLVTLVERASRFVLVGNVPHENAEAVTAEITRILLPYAEQVQTLTFDNGREFAGRKTLAEILGCQTYFAKPYHSWERGTNENTNGLLRQYFPKAMDLWDVTQSDLDFAMQRLNHRPRKVLGFTTPAKVFSQNTSPPVR
jgi:transposase, IS30 family